MNTLVTFEREQLAGAEVSCVTWKGEPWFRAKDITAILQLKNTSQCLKDHVDDEDRIKYKDMVMASPSSLKISMGASVSNVNFINESSLHALAFGSHLPEAKISKRWVTKEITPTLRKTGECAMPNLMEIAERN